MGSVKFMGKPGNTKEADGESKADNPSGRFSIARLKGIDHNEINVLKQLEAYGLHHTILRTLRFSGKPVSVHHLTLMAPHIKREPSMRRNSANPSERFVRTRTGYLNAAIIAEIYTSLHSGFAENPEGSVDARHLLDTWEIYMASRVRSPMETPERTMEHLKRESLDLRVVWQIMQSLAWNLVSLEKCGDCRRPYLKVQLAEVDSTWMSMTPGCTSCNEIRKILARSGDGANGTKRRRSRAKIGRNTPLYGVFSEQVSTDNGDTVTPCDELPLQKRLFSS